MRVSISIIVLITVLQICSGSRVRVSQNAYSQGKSQTAETELVKIKLLNRAAEDTWRLTGNEEESTNTVLENNLRLFNGILHIGEVSLGSPGQTFRVVFDTSCPYFWVVSKGCQEVACVNHAKYDSTKSSTYIKDGRPLSNQAGFRPMEGKLSRDNLLFGGFTIVNQTFGEATHILQQNIYDYVVDGVFGLGFASDSSGYTNSPVYNLFKKNPHLDPVVTFNYRKDFNDPFKAGEIIIGGFSSDLYDGDITYVPVSKKDTWQFRIDGIATTDNRSTICQGGCDAVFNSSSPFIIGPVDDVYEIDGGLYAYLGQDDLFIIQDCDERTLAKLPDIVFTIGGVDFHMKPNHYASITYSSFGGSVCALAIQKDDSIDHWIIGDSFLNAFHTVLNFDKQMIGFSGGK